MKKWNLSFYAVVVLFILFLLIHCPAFVLAFEPYYSQSGHNEINLKITGFFPTEFYEQKGLILPQPWSLAIDDSSKKVALLDYREARVYLFSESGDLLSSFGKKGQGPGEFSLPAKVFFHKDNICVFDPAAHRLQFFDLKGNFKKMIKLFSSYSDILVDDEERLICAKQMKFDAPNLIDLLDQNGQLILSLAEPARIENIPIGLLNKVKLAFLNDYVLVVSQTIGYMKLYDKQGKLIKESDVLRNFFRKEIRENINKNFTQTKRPAYSHLFESVKVNGNNIYFLRSRPGVYEIYEIDELFNLKNIYKYERKDRPNLGIDFDIATQGHQTELKFYVIDLGEEKNRILILSPEKNRDTL